MFIRIMSYEQYVMNNMRLSFCRPKRILYG